MQGKVLLHVETSSKMCSVALSLDGVLHDEFNYFDGDFAHGEKLTVMIEEILAKNTIPVDSLSAISISSGPGSYTGLRIGVSVAKGMCYALNIPLIAVDTLLALSNSPSESAYKQYNRLCLMDARRMEAYACVVDSSGTVLSPVEAKLLDENSFQEFEPLIVIGDCAHKLNELWQNRNVLFQDALPTAALQVNNAWEKYLGEQWEDVAYFEPKYLKDVRIG